MARHHLLLLPPPHSLNCKRKLAEHGMFRTLTWFIINNMYCSKLCLLYPPHMIAITVIYLTLVLNDKMHDAIQAQSVAHTPPPLLLLAHKHWQHASKAHACAAAGLCWLHSRPVHVASHCCAMIAGDPLTLHTVGALLRCCPRVWVQAL
ncbi:hypothetical protein F5148DRAFT_1199865, partial [Russula earlei]